MSVGAREQIDLARPACDARRATRHVVDAVAVDVADAADRRPEPAPRGVPLVVPERRTIFARVGDDAPRKRPGGGRESGADDKVIVAVAVQIADARDARAEPFVRRHGEIVQHGVCLARVDDHAPPRPAGLRRQARPSDDVVGHTVAVDVACAARREAKAIAGRAVVCSQELALLARKDIDAPRRRPGRREQGRGRDEVIYAVSVDVTDVRGEPAEVVADLLALERTKDAGAVLGQRLAPVPGRRPARSGDADGEECQGTEARGSFGNLCLHDRRACGPRGR